LRRQASWIRLGVAAVERNICPFRATAKYNVSPLDLPQIAPAMVMRPDTDDRQNAVRQGFGHAHLRAFCDDRDGFAELGGDAGSPSAGRIE